MPPMAKTVLWGDPICITPGCETAGIGLAVLIGSATTVTFSDMSGILSRSGFVLSVQLPRSGWCCRLILDGNDLTCRRGGLIFRRNGLIYGCLISSLGRQNWSFNHRSIQCGVIQQRCVVHGSIIQGRRVLLSGDGEEGSQHEQNACKLDKLFTHIIPLLYDIAWQLINFTCRDKGSMLIQSTLCTLYLAVILSLITDLAGDEAAVLAPHLADDLAVYNAQDAVRLLGQCHVMRH